MQPPMPIPKILMITIMTLSLSIILFTYPFWMIPIILSLAYASYHIYHYIKHHCRYKHTQYYALYKTPFSHLIKNTHHYKQYIIYQTLLSFFAKNSDMLISTRPYAVLLIHPSGLNCFVTAPNVIHYQKIPTHTITTYKELKIIIGELSTKTPIYSTQNIMQIYDSIMTNPQISFS